MLGWKLFPWKWNWLLFESMWYFPCPWQRRFQEHFELTQNSCKSLSLQTLARTEIRLLFDAFRRSSSASQSQSRSQSVSHDWRQKEKKRDPFWAKPSFLWVELPLLTLVRLFRTFSHINTWKVHCNYSSATDTPWKLFHSSLPWN